VLAGVLKWLHPAPAKHFVEQLTSMQLPTVGVITVGLFEWVLGLLLLAGR